MATTNDQDTSTLYFIVGGLVVLALIFAYVFMQNNGAVSGSGPERIIERTSETHVVPAPAENNTTNYNIGTPSESGSNNAAGNAAQ